MVLSLQGNTVVHGHFDSRGRFTLFAVVLVALLGIFGGQREAHAAAQLMVSPTRVVFGPHERSAQVQLINNGDAAGTFRISFVHKQMNAQGGVVDMDPKAPGMFSDPYIRYSPRQVTLAPGQSQVVRLLLRRPADLAEGEYRSHMLFQNIPDSSASSIERQIKGDQGQISISIVPILGISIPVIFRAGETSGAVTIDGLKLSAGQKANMPVFSMRMHRSGNASVYGDIMVKFRTAGGDELLLGLVKGIAVYTPNEVRDFSMSLQLPDDLKLQDGMLQVEYKLPENETGKVLASAQLAIPAAGN